LKLNEPAPRYVNQTKDRIELEAAMRTQQTTPDTINEHRYLRTGWALLAGAALAVALTVLATAAQPHVLWLFSMSHGAVAMVVGVTLIRIGHHPERVLDGPSPEAAGH
jgi:ABC-type Fe3+-siderophore transport system permease subunit